MSMAARLGDLTAHGGTIVVGFPTVLIGNMPAARIGDNHVCPMVTPGLPPIPHVGGPVTMGSPTVLIGNMPAARVGDMLVCVGPPDTIAMGCPTVMIGMGGGGSGAAGSASPSAAAAAQASAQAAQFDNTEATEREEHWIRFEFKDKAGYPISGLPYRFKDPDGTETTGLLRQDGVVQRTALKKDGQGEVTLMSLSGAAWSKQEAKASEKVKLSAKAAGFEDGTPAVIQIFKRDLTGPDVAVAEIKTTVRGENVEADWMYEPDAHDPDAVQIPPEGVVQVDNDAAGFSGPTYYFSVLAGPAQTRSALLRPTDFIAFEVTDEAGQPLAGEAYVLLLPDGSVRTGQLDGSGRLREEDIPPGLTRLQLPDLHDYDADV